MKIGILGTGNVGQTYAERLITLGHEVMIGTRDVTAKRAEPAKNPNSKPFGEWLGSNPGVQLGTFADAAAFGDMILNVVEGKSCIGALQQAGAKNLEGKILVDVSNPLDFSEGMPPFLIPELSNTNSLGEEIQKTFPGTKVVKALNTMWVGLQVNPALIAGGEHSAFICGNDADAKSNVRSLMKEFGWKDENILDLGDISSSRGMEAILPLWLRVMGAKQSGAFNFKIVQ